VPGASWAGAWHRFPARLTIASIPPRLGQVPGTDFQHRVPGSCPVSRLLASRRALDRCLAPGSWHRVPARPQIASISAASWQVPGTGFQPSQQIASIPPRLGQVPGTGFLDDLAGAPCDLQIASIQPHPWQVPGTGFQPSQQIASIPPRLGQVPGTEFLDDLAGAPCDLQIASIQPHPWQVTGTDFLDGSDGLGGLEQ